MLPRMQRLMAKGCCSTRPSCCPSGSASRSRSTASKLRVKRHASLTEDRNDTQKHMLFSSAFRSWETMRRLKDITASSRWICGRSRRRVEYRPCRNSWSNARVEDLSQPWMLQKEKKMYAASGEAPLATHLGEVKEIVRRCGRGCREGWTNQLSKGQHLHSVCLRYVSRDHARRMGLIPDSATSSAAAAAAPPWAGALGAAPETGSAANGLRVVVDVPNVARYFGSGQGLHMPPLDVVILRSLLEALASEAPEAQVICVCSLSAAHALASFQGGPVRLRCCPPGVDVDEVVLQEAAAPDARGCIISNDQFDDHI
mmetsp:Transcript_46112/g.147233  ORF Transcript_46112/g.147233 Transcript_46112/m.147233 type:complete len:314 (-) Transcript_46112:1523-2464(-)